MLSRASRRALLEAQWPSWMPPSFLIPASTRAWLSTLPNATTIEAAPDAALFASPAIAVSPSSQSSPGMRSKHSDGVSSLSQVLHPTTSSTSRRIAPSQPTPKAQPLALSKNLRTMLPLLKAQRSHYMTLHIHKKGYLVQEGDTIRLPFLMPDVNPGDVLRLNCASTIGSRDFTLKAGSADAEAATLAVVHRNGAAINNSQDRPEMNDVQRARLAEKKRRQQGYLDDRLFVCRAVVLSVESEPLRIMEKTKPRQRHIKHVKSKHRYTCLRISEISLRSLDDIHSTEVTVDIGGEEGLIAATDRSPSSLIPGI